MSIYSTLVRPDATGRYRGWSSVHIGMHIGIYTSTVRLGLIVVVLVVIVVVAVTALAMMAMVVAGSTHHHRRRR